MLAPHRPKVKPRRTATQNRIVNGRTSVTAAMALKLGATFRTTPEFWLDAKTTVDLYRAAGALCELPEPMVQAG
jgi:addiction module HigA family antidote